MTRLVHNELRWLAADDDDVDAELWDELRRLLQPDDIAGGPI